MLGALYLASPALPDALALAAPLATIAWAPWLAHTLRRPAALP